MINFLLNIFKIKILNINIVEWLPEAKNVPIGE